MYNYFIFLLVVLCGGAGVEGVDVVGWIVGNNITDLDRLNWDVYTTVRGEYIRVDEQGNTHCPNTTFYNHMHSLAVKHNKTLTLGVNLAKKYNCIYPDVNSTTRAFCKRYIDSIGPTIRSCGSNIQGISFDYEGHPLEKKEYTVFLDKLQKSMGEPYTVGACVGAFGFDGLNHGASYPLGFLSWVDADIFKKNSNLFVNIMGYHNPMDCSIDPWIKDAFVATEIWGLRKEQVNIGMGYYTTVLKHHNPFKILSENTWSYYSKKCPNVEYSTCICDGIPFVSKKMNEEIGLFVKINGFRGVFPWAANYDSFENNNSLADYIGYGVSNN